jgi:hypothetical protein
MEDLTSLPDKCRVRVVLPKDKEGVKEGGGKGGPPNMASAAAEGASD